MATYAHRTLVPASHGAAVMLPANTEFAVVDVEGGQVGDLFAFNAQDPSEFASASHTRVMLGKLFPQPGDAIYTNQRNEIIRLVADNSPGKHDALYAACDPRRYELMGAPGHRSCAGNLEEAMAQFGDMKCPTPQPFNVFMEVPIDAEGKTFIVPATSAPGDSLIFATLMDTIVALSSCPMDLYAVSSGEITPLTIEF
ncbi:MAG: urea carboxylase-associated family protein [Actinomycetota bacterium]|nr:urea carboxylase-associated family protein [Actinomycetota bacterium]